MASGLHDDHAPRHHHLSSILILSCILSLFDASWGQYSKTNMADLEEQPPQSIVQCPSTEQHATKHSAPSMLLCLVGSIQLLPAPLVCQVQLAVRAFTCMTLQQELNKYWVGSVSQEHKEGQASVRKAKYRPHLPFLAFPSCHTFPLFQDHSA